MEKKMSPKYFGKFLTFVIIHPRLCCCAVCHLWQLTPQSTSPSTMLIPDPEAPSLPFPPAVFALASFSSHCPCYWDKSLDPAASVRCRGDWRFQVVWCHSSADRVMDRLLIVYPAWVSHLLSTSGWKVDPPTPLNSSFTCWDPQHSSFCSFSYPSSLGTKV